MEKLFAYALLYSVGYDYFEKFQNELDRLFVAEPENGEYLSLEEMPHKEAVLRVLFIMKNSAFDSERFGGALMSEVKTAYKDESLKSFAEKMYRMWSRLPETMRYDKPFHTFSYADECLTFGDVEQCRDLYEEAVNFYDTENKPGA